jgi:casein kinase 1
MKPQAAPVKTINTPLRARTPAVPREEMADILNNLTKLNLGAAKNILGDRTNVQEAVRKAKEDAKPSDSSGNVGGAQKKPAQAPGAVGSEVIVISDGSDGGEGADRVPAHFQATKSKAYLLNKLADKASNAPDNATLAELVKEFKHVLQMNSSRTLTKEAFYFLDVLFKQLDDPSVFVKPQK